ncbi:MAG: magnesium transporter [Thiopseudomonas sp.]|nr:magnesium transporter [Thiopseudomonas sp.]
MNESDNKKPQERLQERFAQVLETLQRLQELDELHGPLRTEASEQGQLLAQLRERLTELHTADIAYILEGLPLDKRLTLWQLVHSDIDGDILLEVSDAVRETLLADMDQHEMLAAARELDADELAELASELPQDVVLELMESLDAMQRERVRSALSYEDNQVGAIMDFEMVTVREDVALEVVLRYLRRLKELPDQMDKLFVIDHAGILKGVLPIRRLLVNDPDKKVADVMATDSVTFHPDEEGIDAAEAFERYDLVSAPVVDRSGKLIGRLTIDEMVDLIREETEGEVLSRAGLREEEDIFASVWKSIANRWAWLAVNLVTAFVASRVIGVFEDSIEKLVALAALMPIVAGIGGNSGNQTITMIVRAMALEQVSTGNTNRLLKKELGVAFINGIIWGGVIGLVAWLLYDYFALGMVMIAAMTLNLLLAACMGVLIPMTMVRMGRDPALGSSVLITAMTDSGGFFIFLGLATLFLL